MALGGRLVHNKCSLSAAVRHRLSVWIHGRTDHLWAGGGKGAKEGLASGGDCITLSPAHLSLSVGHSNFALYVDGLSSRFASILDILSSFHIEVERGHPIMFIIFGQEEEKGRKKA